MAVSTSHLMRAAVVDERPRCWRCDKEMAVALTRPWEIKCWRCKAINKRDAPITPV